MRTPSLTALAATAALAASIVSLVFSLWPSLRPDPDERFSATVQIVALDRAVALSDYLHRIAKSGESYKAVQGKYFGRTGVSSTSWTHLGGLVGTDVYARVAVSGFKRRAVHLRWSIYDSALERRLPSFNDLEGAQIRIEAPEDSTVEQIWVPPAPKVGRYFVRVEVYDDRNVLLGLADSKAYRDS